MANQSNELPEVSDKVFAMVARELSSGKPDEALWTKALALQNGNESATKAHYIRLRVEQITRISAKENNARLKQDTLRPADKACAIWNPIATANWSLLFTPVFGLYLQHLNWKTLGEPVKAASARNWFYFMLLVYYIIAYSELTQNAESSLALGYAILLFLVWYFSAGRAQAKYVKEKFGSNYSRKPWWKPLLIGVASYIGVSFLANVATMPDVGFLSGVSKSSPSVVQAPGLAIASNSESVNSSNPVAEQYLLSETKKAEAGDATAQSNLGNMYRKGEGVPQDLSKAFEWFQKLAVQGNVDAQFNLGVMYFKGQGVPQDFSKAVEWYRKAAEQGDATAQFNLSVMYFKGQGVPQNFSEAFNWCQMAAERGDSTAQNNLGSMYYLGQGVPQEFSKAVEWYQKAAEQGDVNAQRDLGTMYGKGIGVPQDFSKAFELLQKAAEQGEATAQLNLGVMYGNGRGVPQDFAKQFEWTQKAAIQGLATAQVHLGSMYYLGQGVPKDFAIFYAWINIAAKAGNKDAVMLRNDSKQDITAAEIAEGNRLSKSWKKGQIISR